MPHRLIALLRGINVTGHNKVSMSELREMCEELGYGDVQTYIQSGNVVLTSPDGVAGAEVEEKLAAGIAERFGLSIPVVVRSANEWQGYVSECPFPAEREETPNLVMLLLSKQPLAPDAVRELTERAAAGERIERRSDTLWMHFPQGVGRSKLTPSILDRAVGSPATMRNWRTVVKLRELSA
jgi:uncharacterized protein (DUF1697 family)